MSKSTRVDLLGVSRASRSISRDTAAEVEDRGATTWRERYLDLEPKYEDLYRQYRDARRYIEMLASGEHSLCVVDGCTSMQDPDSSIGLCHYHLCSACHFDLQKIKDKVKMANTLPFGTYKPSDPYRDCVVYYIDFGQRIKIGTTTNVKKRMREFCQPKSALLAVEPGSYDRERQRHEEFAKLRLERTELFDKGEDLMSHIKLVRDTFGDPAKFM